MDLHLFQHGLRCRPAPTDPPTGRTMTVDSPLGCVMEGGDIKCDTRSSRRANASNKLLKPCTNHQHPRNLRATSGRICARIHCQTSPKEVASLERPDMYHIACFMRSHGFVACLDSAKVRVHLLDLLRFALSELFQAPSFGLAAEAKATDRTVRSIGQHRI